MGKLIEVNIVARERDFALVSGEGEADGSPDGVLKGFAQQEGIGRAEAIVVVTGEPGIAVDVRSAKGWLEVEGDNAARRSDGLRDEQPQFE